MLLGNSLRQTVHTHRAFVHRAAKLVAALLRVARVTVDLAESNGNLMTHVTFTMTAKNRVSSGTLHLVIEYGLPLPFTIAMALCLFMYACHKSVFCRNVWTDRADFSRGGFLRSILHCVIRKFMYL